MLDDVVAEDVSAWRAGFDEVFARVADVFGRVEPRRWARSYLTGLLAPVERKNSWQLADAAGVVEPDGLQHFLNRSRWDADELRDRLRSYVAEALAGPDGVLVVDETGFLKKGTKSVGVQRQYSGTAGRVENSQLGVFLAYASQRGRALIDRELYLPESWISDRERCAEAGIPETRCGEGLLTKPRLAEALIDRALAAGVVAGWVAADSAYGRDGTFRAFLEGHRMPYVVEVPVKQAVADLDGRRRVDTLIGRAPAQAWHQLSTGPGVRGEREYDFAWATLPTFGDLPAGFVRTLLARRSLDDPTDIAYYLCFHPDTVTREQIVTVAGARWAIEECFQASKDQCGLDHYQVRKWDPWYRHITLAMLAHAFLAVTAATDPKAHAGWAESQSPRSAVSWR
ncbi:IS701 family transposase [Nocardia sp. SYP-A9097]|uniref:IS701 family transposase n=1 Tax=Nocardia sp. SYP-A9097 TaxID=2663237 RepID=UPI00129A0F8A|nr:IS701 family transposase [Nocardia sp. SYP-A9097]MRH93559.1 IS701 family transposase [Nocardia sp. SYP-A9097]